MKRQFLSFPTSTPRGLSLQLRDDVEVYARDLLRAAQHVRDLRAHEQLRLALGVAPAAQEQPRTSKWRSENM